MHEFENILEMIPENTPNQSDPYTYYAGKPVETSLPRYVPNSKKKKKKQPWGLILVISLICALLGGTAGALGVLLIQNLQEEDVPEADVSYMMQSIRENTAIEIVEAGTGQLMSPAGVYAANVGSTVGITTSVTTNIWGFQTTSAASGSGFIISTDGYILTNYHVIDDADSITVSLYDGTTYDAALIGYDESKDIAVLKVDAGNLSPVILGDSDHLNVGDQVLAIGNPLGELTFSLIRTGQRHGPESYPVQYRYHASDPDGLRHQLRKFRRCAFQSVWRSHRCHQRQVFRFFRQRSLY